MKHIFTISFFCIVFILSFQSCKKVEKTGIPATPEYRGEIIASPFPNVSTGLLGKGELLVMDYEGNILKSKKLNFAALNFQRWIIDGELRYTYISYNPNTPRIPGVGYVAGEAAILDSDFNVLKQITLLPYNGRTTETAVDAHDFILLDDNHYLVMAYYEKVVNNIPEYLEPLKNCKVVAPIVQEIKDGKVIWEWDGTNYTELYESSVEHNRYGLHSNVSDYAHINSMFIDPKDNNVIFSFRHLDQVIKVNRHTGDIIWRLGGKNSDFKLANNQIFLRQHHATYTSNGTILLFDNGQRQLRPYSRVMEFKLDETSKTILEFNSVNVPGMFGEYMGSVQKVGNNYFVGGGSDTNIIEINAQTGAVVFSKTLETNSYRAFKY